MAELAQIDMDEEGTTQPSGVNERTPLASRSESDSGSADDSNSNSGGLVSTQQPDQGGGGRRRVQILGTRGIPGSHGGFETFAEQLAVYLTERGWEVTVYCQERGKGPVQEDRWNGINRVVVLTSSLSSLASIYFDWLTTVYAARRGELSLVLGYNTAVFCGLLRLRGTPCLINMDGLEWKREKWSLPARAWLYFNERLGCIFGNHLIADHPEIANHLQTRTRRERITTIPYGSNAVGQCSDEVLREYGVEKNKYALVIARAEPENSLLEIVTAFSSEKRNMKLLVLGRYTERFEYQRKVIAAASDEVIFPGGIYDREIVEALRLHTALYIHGHQVGGTNPSLVEALGAGSPVLAHDNLFNRWVAGKGATYFSSQQECASRLDTLLKDPEALEQGRNASLVRHEEEFVLEHNLAKYESLLMQWLPAEEENAESTQVAAGTPPSI